MKIRIAAVCLFAVAALIAGNMSGNFSVHAQSAKEQLEKAGNTGTLFDGSDGNRFGTDTGIKTTGNVPDVPKPTAVETSTGATGGYSGGGSSTAAQGSSNNSVNKDSGSKSDSSQNKDKDSDKTNKTGTEPAR